MLVTYRRNAEGARQVAGQIQEAGGQAFVSRPTSSREGRRGPPGGRRPSRSLSRVDVWVNNAGADILTGEGAAQTDVEKLDDVLDVDLRGTILCSWQVARRMRAQGGGVILNVSWDHVLTGAPGRPAEIYAAAKGGILAFSKCLARSFAPEVRVNVLAPGWIATAFAAGLAGGRAPPHRRGDAAPALGHARGRGAGRAVPGLGRGRVPDGGDDAGERRRGDVASALRKETAMTKAKLGTYSEEEIRSQARGAARLVLEDGWIRRQYKTDGWPTTLMLVNQIGYLAEAAYHHPDLSVTWAKVTVKLKTHSENGITDRDFELARKIEEAVLWRPAAGSALEGTPNKFVTERPRPAAGKGLAGGAGAVKILFVTGKLAAPLLRDTLERACGPRSSTRWPCSGISVAALMTTDWVARFLKVPGRGPDPASRAHPGRRGRSSSSASACARRRDPRTCARSPSTSAWRRRAPTTAPIDVQILAEINNAPEPAVAGDPAARARVRGLRRGDDRRGLHARAGPSPRWRRSWRALRARRAPGQHRQLRRRRGPHRGRGRAPSWC